MFSESQQPFAPETEAATERSMAELVDEKVAELNIGLDLSKRPDLRERLADEGEHFMDSVVMARIVEVIYDDLREELHLTESGPERLKRAALLHDIGKSGPAGEKTELHGIIRQLFVTPEKPFNLFTDGRRKTVREFIAEMDFPNAAEMESVLTSSGFDIDTEPIIEFLRRHAQWTYDILTAPSDEPIDAETVVIAATHHLFENKNPANVDLEHVPAEANILEVMEMAEMLAAVDKYQAMRDRGNLNHETSIKNLLTAFNARPPELPETLREKYRAIIHVLDKNREALNSLTA